MMSVETDNQTPAGANHLDPAQGCGNGEKHHDPEPCEKNLSTTQDSKDEISEAFGITVNTNDTRSRVISPEPMSPMMDDLRQASPRTPENNDDKTPKEDEESPASRKNREVLDDFIETLQRENSARASECNSSPRDRAKSFKLMEMPPASVGMNEEPPSPGSTASPTKNHVFPAVQIPPTAVENPKEAKKSTKEEEDQKRELATKIPELVTVPFEERCSFCQKMNSICFKCSRKWTKETQPKRAHSIMKQIAAQADSSKIFMLFGTVARGDANFLKYLLESHPGACNWFAPFSPLPGDKFSPLLLESGKVFPLHVACAYDRVNIAKVLLEHGSKFRRSEFKILPLQYLPIPFEEKWDEMLLEQRTFQEHMHVEKARALRQAQQWAGAEEQYALAEAINPKNEHVHCGRAKMAFDRQDFFASMKMCEQMVDNPQRVEYVEFGVPTMQILYNNAHHQWHLAQHGRRGSLKRCCGCIITDFLRLPIRKLKFQIIREKIIPYLDGVDAFAVWKALGRMPLWEQALIQHVNALPKTLMTNVLLSDAVTTEKLSETTRADFFKAKLPLVEPIRFVGFRVEAVADFMVILVVTVVEGANPNFKKKEGFFSFGKKDQPEKFICKKQFQMSRRSIEAQWDISQVGEWELTPVFAPK